MNRCCQKYSPEAICSVSGCGVRPLAKNLCRKHYDRMCKNGTTDSPFKPMRFADLPPAELAIAAGLMEGEGSVRLNSVTRGNKGNLIVCMTNTNLEIIEWMNARWPGHFRSCAAILPGQKPFWRWVISSLRAMAFLDLIEPFAITWRMKERIRTARWWQEIKAKHWQLRGEQDYEEAFSCWHWMSTLNRRGVAA